MGQVSITLNDRTFRLVCEEGEEDRLVELASYVKAKVDALTAEVGHVGDERLVLMAALQIADELWDARADLDMLSAPSSGSLHAARLRAPEPLDTGPEPVKRLKSVAARLAAEREGASPPAAEPEPPVGAQGTLAAAKARRRDIA